MIMSVCEMTDLTMGQSLENLARQISECGDAESGDFDGTVVFKKQGKQFQRSYSIPWFSVVV